MNRELIHSGSGRRIIVLLVVLLLGLTIAACDATGGGSDGESAETSPPGREDDSGSGGPGVADKEPTAREKGKDWEVVMTTDKKKYRVGEEVPLILTLTNLADTSLELTFPSAKTHDFIVRDERGRTVWQWSSGRAFAQALTERTLVAGGRLKRDAVWDGRDNQGKPAKAGQYEAEGWFTAQGFDRRVGPLSLELR